MATIPTPENSGPTYEPPTLPDYLKKIHDLKSIVGVPSDDEVKGIHAVIRAAYNVAHIPGMFNPTLSMQLAQHLFEVQMARYRDKYPFGLFLGNTVYTPPPLPSHVPVTLEPVVGSPSDEEVQEIQAAARAYENFANVPSLFDSQVSMELSQHLFNIQIARYMKHAAQEHPGIKHTEYSSREEIAPQLSTSSIPQARNATDSAAGTLAKQTSGSSNQTSTGPAADAGLPQPSIEATDTPASDQGTMKRSEQLLERLVDMAETLVSDQSGQGAMQGQGCDQLLERLIGRVETLVSDRSGQDTMKGCEQLLERLIGTEERVGKLLIETQNSLARGMRGVCVGKNWPGALGSFELLNDKGERPKTHGLPAITRWWDPYLEFSKVTNEQLAQYLLFYGIRSDLVKPGSTPTIKDGRRGEAEAVVLKHVN